MLVLGLETSCDETGVALYDSERGLLADALFSQIELHRLYGGVVPELASRDHIKRMLPLIEQVLADAQCKPSDIEGIAYTAGPGLVGALLVGASCAQALAFAWDIPSIGVHHMEGHLLAPMLEDNPPQFPFVALLVSGGHTQLVRVDGIGQYCLLGESIDDAAGEAFDKTAKLMGLRYPGGPEIARIAEQGQAGRFVLPKPMTDRPGLQFSFSGLKTATLTAWQKCVAAGDDGEQTRADLAHAFQLAGVAITAGMLIGLYPPAALLAMAVWLLTFSLTRISSLAALASVPLCLPLLAWQQPHVLLPVSVLSLLLVWRHRRNLKDLLAGNERSFKD